MSAFKGHNHGEYDDECPICYLDRIIETLTAENKNLWDAINLERRLKHRFIGALEKAGIDPDEVMATIPKNKGGWNGRIFENHNLTVGKSRPKTFREQWLSWPWRPWRANLTWQEPDSHCYLAPYPPLFEAGVGFYDPPDKALFAHPVTAAKIRASVLRGQK